jgi:hypothetical protein
MMQLQTDQGFDEHAAFIESKWYCGECGYNFYTCNCGDAEENDDTD